MRRVSSMRDLGIDSINTYQIDNAIWLDPDIVS